MFGEDWVAKPELPQLCNFAQANLCQPPLPFHERFDVIFLCNVCFILTGDAPDLMAGIHKLLASDGILFLGSPNSLRILSLWNAVLAGVTCHSGPVLSPSPLDSAQSNGYLAQTGSNSATKEEFTGVESSL